MFTRKELNYLRDPYFRIIREEDQYIVKDIQEQKYYKLTATEIKNFNLKYLFRQIMKEKNSKTRTITSTDSAERS